MNEREPLTADDLIVSAACVRSALEAGVERDWSTEAGSLEWTCLLTVDHIIHCLLLYAAQLATQADTRYVRLFSRARLETAPSDLLEVVEASARILASVVQASPPRARAFHPSGRSDAEGFAGMGCVEVLLHGHDIATGLGLTLTPPEDLCGRVLARMFPERSDDLARMDVGGWVGLRWATGRASIEGRPDLVDWRWRGAPLTESA